MNRTRFAIAIAVVCVACVKVPDDIKATFAPGNGSETDNFSPRSPHAIAPPELTQATAVAADASTSVMVPEAGIEGMCPREPSAMSSSAADCLHDAGDQ